MLNNIGIVVIGRNQGERLRACLASVTGNALCVYVDSGSSDGSAAMAREMGIDVVALDHRSPFTAARARNEGFDRLTQLLPAAEFVQFIDGDCQLVDGWLEDACRALRDEERVAAICGRRREQFPDRSIYNGLMDLEWNRPAGLVASVGGDAMFRVSAFRDVGGFNPQIVAGEEPELCVRLRDAGWHLRRIGREMTLHDANMLTFAQWWRRQVRSGFGASDVFARTDGRVFGTMLQSVQFWTATWIWICVLAALIGPMALIIAILLVPAQMLHIAARANRGRPSNSMRIAHGFFTMLGKWAMLMGRMRYLRNAEKH